MSDHLFHSKRLLVVLICLVLILTACGSRDPLLGNWEEPFSGVTMDFEKGGILIMGMKGVSFTMTYTLEDPNIMIFKASEGTIPEQRMTYRFEDEKLILTVDGIDTTFIRKK